MGRVIVLGSSNLDIVLRTPRLPGPGETVLGQNLLLTPGGKGANQALAAARAGATVSFLGAVGDDDHARLALPLLLEAGVDMRYLKRCREQPTGVALIVVDAAGRNQIVVAPGANGTLTVAEIADYPAEVFLKPGVFVAQLETPLPTVQAGLQRARSAGLRTVLNPTPVRNEIGTRDWLALVDVLVLNEPEAWELTGLTGDLLDEPFANAVTGRLHGAGASALVITLGERGYLLAEGPGRTQHEAALPVHALDTTGAGDVFVGVLAAGLAENLSLSQACQQANRAAALATTRFGAQVSIPTRAEVEGHTW